MTTPDSLRALLRRWQHTPPAAPDFAAGVWARIDAARRDRRVVLAFRWSLPLAASLAVFLGVGAARTQVRKAHAERMAAAYVRTVDPVQMADHGTHGK